MINTLRVVDGNGIRNYEVATCNDADFISETKKPYPLYSSLAEKYALNEAIIVGKFYEIVHSKNSDKSFIIPHNGWNYIKAPLTALQILFPFFSASTIRRAMKRLEDNELIHSENLTDNKFDKTKCYCINSNLIEYVVREKENKINGTKRTTAF